MEAVPQTINGYPPRNSPILNIYWIKAAVDTNIPGLILPQSLVDQLLLDGTLIKPSIKDWTDTYLAAKDRDLTTRIWFDGQLLQIDDEDMRYGDYNTTHSITIVFVFKLRNLYTSTANIVIGWLNGQLGTLY